MKLYPYQEKAAQHAIQMLDERGNSLVVAATGAGKTIMLAGIIGKFYNGFYAKNKRKPHILVLVHRTEIHDQNHSKFSKVVPSLTTSEITATRKRFKGFVHFAMVQTFANVKEELPEGNYYDLIVVDEAHHSKATTYTDIIEWNKSRNPQACLLGVTATPNRGDRMPLLELFDNFYQITFKFLFDSHYLVRPTMLDKSLVFHLNTFNKEGELIKSVEEKGKLNKNIKDIEEREKAIKNMIDIYLASKLDGKSVVFAPSHEFCKQIYEELKQRGREPSYLSLGLDDITRKEELQRFETGNAEELINVDICTEGYDFPQLRNLVEFDTNGSHTQWVQKVGRVLRTAQGKTECRVIDFGGNIALYPEGVECKVNLEGAVKKEKGEKLIDDDFFKEESEPNSNQTFATLNSQNDEIYTPYHLPYGFETVNDSAHGIVFVSCGTKKDVLIIGGNNTYMLFTGDKTSLQQAYKGDFNLCIIKAIGMLGEIKKDDRPISNIQIKMLAPDYSTATLTRFGANCCICWKTWKKDIERVLGGE